MGGDVLVPVSENVEGPAAIKTRSPREEWLEERRKGVGASEVAAILGVDPRRGPLAVYADKIAARPSEEEEIYMTFGRDVEVAIARGYSRKTHRVILPRNAYEIVRHPALPILGATLDFECDPSKEYPAPITAAGVPAEGAGILETKAVGFHKRDEWVEDTPLNFVVQVQMQMACRGRTWGSLGALMGGIAIADPVDMLPNPEFVEVALKAVAEFWWRVENRNPPEADAKPATRDAIRRLWPGDNGTAIAFTQEDQALVDAWEAAGERKGEAEERYDRLVNQLAVRLGDASEGRCPDGSSYRYHAEAVAAQLCRGGCGTEVKKAHTRRVPRRWWPKGLRPKKGVSV